MNIESCIHDAPNELGASLASAERCLAAVSQALLHGQPDLLEASATDLQRAAHRLSGAMQGRQATAEPDIDLRQRLGAALRCMAMQREACVRRLAVVERSLHSIIPSTRPTTYAGAVGPYARAGKQSGAFRAFS